MPRQRQQQCSDCSVVSPLRRSQVEFSRGPPSAMEMRKIACAVLVAAASATSVLAAEAPAPGPASASFAVNPVVGPVIGACVLSFFALYLQ
ncbi:hypothetical protein C4D60_Mb03t10430 [Musa balbisiana]|uniref:Uncharacterized protein n=1 Tax=Musa balbisiana TaxID=52838 RepID=A0A4S8J904_MUSBA|nr:hypothetical protein C4D60_Mb03t10430 [Musa balbisiana]